ncbi:hypothetical protein HCJ66_04750 [Listeria sp. FSL L7-1582]|uniref:hypothetical protein n=1 Tax=Listeria portnoyi TaxID=2713504 RepID=UPI00164D9EE5|nr:hypothetical protein [Listeria portnoyi]MBC6308862.1 hypothetical protein [Listeria portnoyi]
MKLILTEMKKSLDKKIIIISGILIFVPMIYTFVNLKKYDYSDWLSVYANTVGGILALLFPLIVSFLYLIYFHEKLSKRFIVYTRTRRDIKKTVKISIITNVCLVFSVVFLMMFIPFIFYVYIEPILGIIKYVPENSYLFTAADILKAQIDQYAFTQLIGVSPFFYGFVYSIWVAINGVLWSLVTFYLTLILNNVFLGISIPFVVYEVMNFVCAMLGFPQYSSMIAIFPFNIGQLSFWDPFVPFVILVAVVTGMVLYVHKNVSRMDSLL